VIRQILAIGENLKHGIRSINEIVVFDEEEITEEILQNRVKDVTRRIDELQKHYKRARLLAGPFPTILAKEKAREYRRCRCSLGRGPQCTIMLMHCRRLHGFGTRRQIFTLLLLNVAR
jgi:RNA polymerase primary sigma factor